MLPAETGSSRKEDCEKDEGAEDARTEREGNISEVSRHKWNGT